MEQKQLLRNKIPAQHAQIAPGTYVSCEQHQSLHATAAACVLGLQVSDVLAKVVRQQAEVVDLAEKRAEVLSCIEEFEAVRAECRWLTEYEHDEMRYKVSTVICLAYCALSPCLSYCTAMYR